MRVLISVPNTGWIHKHVLLAVTRMMCGGSKHSLKLITPTHTPYENNLHHIVNDFMRTESNYSFWVNIDSDNPPKRNPLDLVDMDLDIVGLPTPVWHHTGKEPKGERPIYWNGYKWNEDRGGYNEFPIREGLQLVDAVGTGCFVVSRRVFEHPKMRLAPFQRKCNEDGTVKRGNDISFCERARSCGFEVWCHYEYPCMHFNELELNEVFGAFQGLYE